MQDKFRLDLSDEEAVHYMQSLIDESVHALFAAVVEQIHKFAQVSSLREACFSRFSTCCPESSWSHTPHPAPVSSGMFWGVKPFLIPHWSADMNMFHAQFTLKCPTYIFLVECQHECLRPLWLVMIIKPACK